MSNDAPREAQGYCCYGGIRSREECASCAKWIAAPLAASKPEPLCDPTKTECPRCKNNIEKCDGVFAADKACKHCVGKGYTMAGDFMVRCICQMTPDQIEQQISAWAADKAGGKLVGVEYQIRHKFCHKLSRCDKATYDYNKDGKTGAEVREVFRYTHLQQQADVLQPGIPTREDILRAKHITETARGGLPANPRGENGLATVEWLETFASNVSKEFRKSAQARAARKVQEADRQEFVPSLRLTDHNKFTDNV